MVVKLDGSCFQCSRQPLFPWGPFSPKSVSSVFSSLSSTRNGLDRALAFRIVPRSCYFGSGLTNYPRSRPSSEDVKQRGRRRGRRSASFSACLDPFIDNVQDNDDELALEFDPKSESMNHEEQSSSINLVAGAILQLPLSRYPEILPISTNPLPERAASIVDVPMSLRILKRKKQQWRSAEDLMEYSACSSVKKAFSSMVFIVRELQSHTIRVRETFFSESFPIQSILARVQGEVQCSFIWLFQRIFSATPNLMICLMLLLANFAVYSIADHSATAAVPPPQPIIVVEESHQIEPQNTFPRLHSSALKSFSGGKSSSVGGSGTGGGGGRVPPVAGASDDGGSEHFSSFFHCDSKITPEGMSMSSTEEDEAMVWKETADAEPEDSSAYWAAEISYRRALSLDPGNPLILSNFAQFLYLVIRDYEGAGEYFKRAAEAEPADAEALNQYANFLWSARKDLGSAEEKFLEAIAADPENSYYAANYAHFLWSTGGEDTCYPLDGCEA